MRKDGIQTRKRKPKKSGSSAAEVLGLTKKDDMHNDDIKPGHMDRNGNTKLLLPPSPKIHLSNSPSRSHISPHITHNPHSHLHHTTHHQSYSLPTPLSQMQPSKYDHHSHSSTPVSSSASSVVTSSAPHSHHSVTSSASNPHLYASPLITSQSNSHSSYLHNNSLSSPYSNVKSESSIPGITNGTSVIPGNYDYMNNPIQNSYFTGSFSTNGSQMDIPGFHHQHNVIQAAKLMASS